MVHHLHLAIKTKKTLPNGIKKNVNEEGVALSRDVSFSKEDLVVTAFHQILK